MKFPRRASADADGRADALDRLDDARDEKRHLAERRDAADAGPGEAEAAADLRAADQRLAAREAWAEWAKPE